MPEHVEELNLNYDKTGRVLYDDINDEDLKSNQCKLECIDQEKNFCATNNYQAGVCCRMDEDCPKRLLCSEDNPRAPLMFKYLTCPNEKACEDKVITPQSDGTVLKRVVDKYEYKFVKNDICSYIVESPYDMGEYDKMVIKIYNIEKAEVYLAKGKGYRWLDHLDGMVEEGDQFDTKAGW